MMEWYGCGMTIHIAALDSHSGCVDFVAYTMDDSTLATASNRGTVQLWDSNTGAHITTFTPHLSSIDSMTLSRDASRLALILRNGKEAWLWDAVANTPIPPLHHYTPITPSGGYHPEFISLTFSVDGAKLASATNNGSVGLWDASTGTKIAVHRGDSATKSDIVKYLALSPGGSRIALLSRDKLQLWDGVTGTPVTTLGGHSDMITSVTLSTEGSRIASASRDKTVTLWDSNTRAHIATLEGHVSTVNSHRIALDSSLHLMTIP
jgi:WD40 repeat protein